MAISQQLKLRIARWARLLGDFSLSFLEYVPLLITVALASYASFYADSKAVADRTILQWIIAVLGLTAVSHILERFYRLRRIMRDLNTLSTEVREVLDYRVHATHFYVPEFPDMTELIIKSRRIDVTAVNAQQFVLGYKNELTSRIRDGAQLRVLVVDPQSEAAKQIANPTIGLTVDYLVANSAITRQTLSWLSHERRRGGDVLFRYMSYVPMFAAYAFDFEDPDGTIVVGLYRQFWSHDTRRPFAILTRQRDGLWYDFYALQLDEGWTRGTNVSLP